MWEDPIVEDVHRTREKLAAEHGFDVKAIFADLRREELGGLVLLVLLGTLRAATRDRRFSRGSLSRGPLS